MSSQVISGVRSYSMTRILFKIFLLKAGSLTFLSRLILYIHLRNKPINKKRGRFNIHFSFIISLIRHK